MVASAFPLAEVALRVADERRAAAVTAREAGEGNLPSVDDLPFSDSEEGSLPPTSSSETGALVGLDGASSRPGDAGAAFQDRASASGSVILSQVLGAAKIMGHGDVEVPELPVARLASKDPLRAAILEWIAATGALVPADELATQLARADAMPIAVQRDVALLLLAATDATLLQRAALAGLRPEELAWIHAHPEVAEDLVAGVDSDDARTMAVLAAKVDMKQSVAATLLMLHAIEATRGSLSKVEAAETIDKLNAADLDETTRAIMQLLATARAGASDKDKVLLAAHLVALSAGLHVPAAGPAPSFADALAALTSASHQVPDTAALATVLARAKALPDDLEGAIARLLMAEANAINAANPIHFTPTSQPQALVNVLVATAETLPVLQKYGFYWRAAPAALRMGEWDPASRLGWAAHHGALLVTARNDITELAGVAPILSGHSFATVARVPERTFIDAYLAVSREAGFDVTDDMIADLSAAVARLDPAVRDAAAILLSGTAESARLHREAFARLTPEEKRFLLHETDGLDALYVAPTISDADLARLERATILSQRVDADKLARSGVVVTLATAQAKELLDGRDAFSTQASSVTHVATGLRGLLARLSPIGTARAQPDPCTSFSNLLDCDEENDILLRLYYPPVNGFTPAEYVAFYQRSGGSDYAYTCDQSECSIDDPGGGTQGFPTLPTAGEATHELLVITGEQSETYTPQTASRRVCPSELTFFDTFSAYAPTGIWPRFSSACRYEEVARYGAATIHLDLGGHDTYRLPVGMVHINATLPVSIMLDMGGDDRYADPSSNYDAASPLLRDLGFKAGHPTQASAIYGGVAVLVDVQGDDNYAATSRSQGFGRVGLGLLADLSGEDIYNGRDFMQGASSETFSLGAGILLDQSGNDDYTTVSGQGFGLGGVLLDVGGLDVYRNEHDALGVPIVHLDVLPGGDVSTLDARADNRIWLDGPGSINVGIGIDQEAILTTGDDDSDTWPDVIEFIVGTDPEDREESPQSNPGRRAEALTADSDGDGYPDYIERALSTDPEDGSSYPAGFPTGVAVNVPAEVMSALPALAKELLEIDEDGRLAPFEDSADDGSSFAGSDKIIDLRLPVQDAGTIDYGCTGEYYLNSTAPMGLRPGENALLFINGSRSEDDVTGGANRTNDGKVFEHCVRASYATNGPGQGNATVPYEGAYPFTFQIPAGILAVGDIVDTNYTADYFVTIDLGGSDDFWNSAGGALIVQTRPIRDESKGQKANDGQAQRVTNTFIAPALTISIDLNETTRGIVESGDPRGDRYDNDTRDFAHGSYFGVLVDTDGEDLYRARDGSQGAMGGVLLDLAGSDQYDARDLSQGAGLAATAKGSLPKDDGAPPRPVQDLPNGGNLPADQHGGPEAFSTGSVRRALPGILLDLSNESASTVNTFIARSHSQGFARGYPATSRPQDSAPLAYGILATMGGKFSTDVYDTLAKKGRYSQGVGGVDGVGILLDRDGDDFYFAGSLISQGATISQRVNTQDARLNSAPHPATGILADLGGADTYRWSDGRAGGKRSEERQNTLTIERSDTATSTTNPGRVYADLGIHIDAVVDPSNPMAALNALAGTQGEQSFVSTKADDPFHVYMPAARLAIGKNTATDYSEEFAFVVDLGGDNRYFHNAGGFVRDVLAEANTTEAGQGARPVTGVYGATANLFPVTLVVDAGLGNSTYNTSATFAQGAGYFGVGIVADLGGRDVFRAIERAGESHPSRWVQTPPIVDANVGSDWGSVPGIPITLQALEDDRFVEPWTLRVANDGSSLYIALEGRTNSATPDARKRDVLIVDLDMGRRQQEWDYKANRTGIDQILVTYDDRTGRCIARDRAWNDTYQHWEASLIGKGFTPDDVQSGGLAVDCRFTEDGQVTYEIKKDLLPSFPYDSRDLAYCYNEDVGFGYATNRTPECAFPGNELGMLVRFADTGAGYYEEGGCTSQNPCAAPAYFTWPAGAVDQDGAFGHRRNGNISDEMTEWAAIGLAELGEDGTQPANTVRAALSQGVGLAGVGVVALLGTVLADSEMYAGTHAQGYAAYGGLAVVVDTAGSDKYVSHSHALGAAQTRGFALFLEMEGNDNYHARNASLGWSPIANTAGTAADGGTSAFLDLGGDDEYRLRPLDAQRVTSFRGALSEPGALPRGAGNHEFWVQNQSVGADYRIVEQVRKSLADATVQTLFGQTRTRFVVTHYDDTQVGKGPWGNGCSTRAVESRTTGGTDVPDFVVRGKVCFVATVDTGNGIVARLPVDAPETAEAALRQLASQTQGATPTTTVEVAEVLSVDFLVDRARVDTTYTKIDVTNRITSWSSVVDLSAFPDGVSRGKALPLFAAKVGPYGTYVFQDATSNAIAESSATTASRVLLIDNPPIPQIGLEPAYTGRANATFSPYAYGAQQSLYVNYSVNHDVGEDRYVQANAFRANLTNSSLPCVGLPPRDDQGAPLCNIIPFYLGTDGDTLTTEPGTDAGVNAFGAFASPRVVPERIEDQFDAKTPALRTPLVIHAEDSFHLALPGRLGLQPHLEYVTSVRVFLENAKGQQVLNETNDIWYLGEKVGYGGRQTPSVPISTSAIFTALGVVGNQVETVVGILSQENAARATVAEAYATICGRGTSAANDTGKYNSEQCRQLRGQLGPAGSFAFCGPGPGNPDLFARTLYSAVNTVNNATIAAGVGPSTCRNVFQTLNQTTEQHGGITGDVTAIAGGILGNTTDDVIEALEEADVFAPATGRVDNVNFTDFYFSVNKTPPRSAPHPNHCADATKPDTCVRLDASGNVVIPIGFKLALEFELKAPFECPVNLCAIADARFEELADGVNATIATGSEATGVNLYNPLGLSNFDPINTSVVDPLRQQNGDQFRQQPPGALFYVKSGPPGDQPRFEIRVPAEPSTDVSITIDDAATGETAVVLHGGGKLVGDRPGTTTRDDGVLDASYWAAANETPHVNWTVNDSGPVGRWTQKTLSYNDPELADGLYHVRVSASDGSQQTVSRTETLLVDRTAPLTFVRTDVFTGKATLRAGAIPVDWAVFEQGAGLREVWLYTREGTAGDVGDIKTWTLVGGGKEPFPPNVRTHLKSKSATEDTYLFMTIGVDRAGNVEGVQSTLDDPVPDIAAARERAFAAKIALGSDVPHGYRKVFLDQADPLFSSYSIVGGKLVNYQGSDFTFVRAGAAISFGICARDPESGIGLVNLSLDHIDPATGVLKTVTFVTKEAGECDETGGRLFVNDTWHTMNQDAAAFPEGVWSITFDVFDSAGNKLPVGIGNLILDHSSPTVTLQAPVLPTGQSAVKPGDVVKIRLVATDDFGVDEGGIRVDASSFAKNATALKTRPVRVNGVIFQEATFTVDLPNLQNGVFDVTVSVPDFAGNVTQERAQIAVDFKPFQFVARSLRVSNVTHNALTLHWQTDEPTSSLAKFGTTSIALTGRTPQDINATIDHALRVEGLSPSTHYFLRAVAVSAGGFTKESELIEVDTGSALFLSPVSPVAGGKVSGLVPIKFRGGLLDSADFVTFTLEVRDSATKPWTFVTTATRQGDSHELSWNSTRFLDGKAYELRLTAEAGRDRSVLVIDRLTSDNTPPSVLVLSPLLATNDTTPTLTAEASDSLSGLAATPAQLLVDGKPIAQNLSVEALSAGRLRYTHTFPLPLAPGMRTFELRVSDLAGNVAKETWQVAIDGDAPNVTVNPTRYAPGTAAAKRGGTVTLNLTIEDLSGVSLVVADASGLNPLANETRLVKLVNTNNWQGTIAVTAGEESATKAVSVRAVDLAGNVRTLTVNVPLDNVAPQVAATSIVAIGHRRAVIDVPANEQILVNGTARAPASPAVTAATSDASMTARLTFDGLLPSRTYQYRLTAVDRAGNAVDLAGSFATLQDTIPPSGVGPISVLDLLNGTLRLTWAPATDDVLVSHYRVYRSDDGVTFQLLAETPSNVHEDWGLPYEKTYVYKVAAMDFGANEGEASPSLSAAATAVPHLTAGTVTPTVGTTATTFRYSVTYLSPGGVAPAYVRVILDGVPQNMSLESGDARTGAVYTYETRLAPHKRDAPHSYAYEASDGRYTVRFPEDGSVVRGPLVSGDILADGGVGGFASFAQRVPLGGVAGVALAMIAAAGLAALIRRKKEGSK